jgi:Ni/Co efflux regulator RcnB
MNTSMTKLLCCILATLIVGAFCTTSAQDASDRRKRNEDRSDRRSDQRATEEEEEATEGDGAEKEAAEAATDGATLILSPLEAEKIRLKALLKRLHSDDTQHYSVYTEGEKHFSKRAAELKDKAEKYAEAREKRRITEKTTTEKWYDWYDQLATMLNAAGATRRQIQVAAYQNPIKPKIDTKKAEEVFEIAVTDFKELHKNSPKKKRQRRKG